MFHVEHPLTVLILSVLFENSKYRFHGRRKGTGQIDRSDDGRLPIEAHG